MSLLSGILMSAGVIMVSTHMARNRKNKHRGKENRLKSETIQGVIAIISFALGILLTLSAFGKAGIVGNALYGTGSKGGILTGLLGIGYFMLPLMLILYGVATLKAIHSGFSIFKTIAAGIFFLSGLGIIGITAEGEGGILGGAVAIPFLKLFGTIAGITLLVALLIICILIVFDTGINLSPLFERFAGLFRRKKDKLKIYGSVENEQGDEEDEEKSEEDEYEEEDEEEPEKPLVVQATMPTKKAGGENGEFGVNQATFRYTGKKVIPIPLNLLEKDRGTPGVGDIKANANIIKRTLQNFGIDVEMDEITIGPTVTRYALKPAEGIKLSRIVGLQNDLSLALAAHPL